jgi:hypothetical protein
MFLFESVFQGGVLVNKEDLLRRGRSRPRWWPR